MRNLFLTGIFALAALPAQAVTLDTPDHTVAESFATTPEVKDWATKTFGTYSGRLSKADELDKALIEKFDATVGLAALKSETTTENYPHAVLRSDLAAIQSRTSSTDYAVIVARAVNRTGAPITRLKLEYDQGTLPNLGRTEQIPGFRVFMSTTGRPGSWTPVPDLSGVEDGSRHLVATLEPADFTDGKTLYVAWADDNAASDAGAEKAYTLAHVRWTPQGEAAAAAETATAEGGATLKILAGVAAVLIAGGVGLYLWMGKKKPAAIPCPSGRGVPLPPPPGAPEAPVSPVKSRPIRPGKR